METELIAARTFLRQNFPRGGRVLCAVSGGLDSMCLLHFLSRQADFAVSAAHFNHQLRGAAADRDERFVRSWCAERRIPFFSGRGDVAAMAAERGLSLEEAARLLRYEFLEQTAEAEGFDAIFTAHHADDSAETMLLNLIRGTGTAGLTGIPPVRGKIFRPFLRLSREALAAYAAAHHLPHVEDETTADPDIAARNLIRLRVMPLLREINPQAVENMGLAADVLRRENESMDCLSAKLLEQAVFREGEVCVPCSLLLSVPAALAERTVLGLLTAAAGHRRDFSSAHVEAVMERVACGRGQVSLPYGLTARVRDGLLVMRSLPGGKPAPLLLNQPVRWGSYLLTLRADSHGQGLALREGTAPLFVAPWTGGERLFLPGSRGARTAKRLCQDQKIPLEIRETLPGIWVGDRLAAIWPLGVDMDFCPVGTACRFIEIQQIQEKSHEQ